MRLTNFLTNVFQIFKYTYIYNYTFFALTLCYILLPFLSTLHGVYTRDCLCTVVCQGRIERGGLWGCNPPKEKQRKAAAQCKRARILRASAAAWYRRASFYVVVYTLIIINTIIISLSITISLVIT